MQNLSTIKHYWKEDINALEGSILLRIQIDESIQSNPNQNPGSKVLKQLISYFNNLHGIVRDLE